MVIYGEQMISKNYCKMEANKLEKSKRNPGKISLIFSILFFLIITYFTLKGWMHKVNLFTILLGIYWLIYFIIRCIKYIKKKEKYNAISCILCSLSILVSFISQFFIE